LLLWFQIYLETSGAKLGEALRSQVCLVALCLYLNALGLELWKLPEAFVEFRTLGNPQIICADMHLLVPVTDILIRQL
jgi:hypothetical protein